MPESDSNNPVKKEWPFPIFQTASLVISILGFLLVVLTLKSADKTYRTGTYLQTYGWNIDIDKTFIQYPEMRPYFYDNISVKPSDTINTNRAKAIAELMLDNLDAVLANNSYFENNPGSNSSWIKTMYDEFKNSPVLREVYGTHPEYWPYITAARLSD